MAKRRGALAKDPPLRGQARREAKAKARGEAPPPPQTQQRKQTPPRKDNRQGGQKTQGRQGNQRTQGRQGNQRTQGRQGNQRTQGRQGRPSGQSGGQARRKPGEFKHAENQAAYNALNPKQQARYRKILANKGRAAANAELAKMSGMQTVMPGQRPPPAQEAPVEPVTPTEPSNEAPPPPPPGEEPPFQEMPFPEQVNEVVGSTGNVMDRMSDIAAGFDPNRMQQNYEMQFNQEMDRYRQNVMSQFERRNQRQFEQQRLGVQQQIAERGLDPASPAAQELMRQQNEREDMARQEAMSAAEQGAYGIQQQAFGQARESALMPGQIFGQFQDPFMARMGFESQTQLQQGEIEAQARQAELQRQFEAGQLDKRGQQELEQLRIQNKQRKWEVRNQPRAGGGGGTPGPNLYERMEANNLAQGNQPPQQNPWANVAQGAATSFAGAFGAGLAKGSS